MVIQWVMKIWYLLTYRFKREKLYIIKAQLSGEGSFIDIRYRITRPDRAKNRELIYLVDEKSEKKFYIMKLPRYGAIQTKHRRYQNTGILLFRNLENTIKSGSKITLVFGKLEVRDIIIK